MQSVLQAGVMQSAAAGFGWAGSGASELAKDVEMQPHELQGSSIKAETYHMAALHSLFGLSEVQLLQLPGALAYCRYLEGCFQPLLSDEYASVWTAIGKRRPEGVAECWLWFTTVTSTIQTLQKEDSNVGCSIEDIWDRLRIPISATNIPMQTDLEKTACLIAIFSVLCWGTMSLQPRLSWIDFKGSPSLMFQRQPPDQPGLKMDFVRRPIPAIFRNFQRTISTGRWRQPIGVIKNPQLSSTLYVSSLNYASLKMIRKIHLVWVDDLSSHLDFDSTNRHLSIFRFPSFCALNILQHNRTPVFDGLVRALYGVDSVMHAGASIAQSHQEVLMSYRLLFGQTVAARRLVKASLKPLRGQPEYDQLLDLVCGRPCDEVVRALPSSLWPVSCQSFEGYLQEEDTYSSQDDFPLFGQRIVKLQEFNLRQQPSKLRDLWRDRRNPLQWYTFWAVLVVGGCSLFFAFGQLLIAIIQLAVSCTPPSICKC